MATKPESDQYHFEGFEGPSYTQVPDGLFDELLSVLGGSELKALLYIVRRTYGFKRNSDHISFNQFIRGIKTKDGRILDRGCGVRDRTTLSKALKSLEAKGIVISEKGVDEKGDNVTTLYSLRFKESAEGVVGKSYQGSMKNPLPVVGKSYPQETVLQKTVQQDNSNIRKVSKDKKVGRKITESIKPDASGIKPLRDDPEDVTAPLSSGSTSANSEKESAPAPDVERDGNRGSAKGLESIGETLKGRVVSSPVPEYDEDRQILLAFMQDFARMLNDQAPLKSSVTRAYNIFKKSGLSMEAFTQKMYQARSITQERTASIKKTAGKIEGLGPRQNKIPYFFSVLAHMVGVQEAEHYYQSGEGSSRDGV